MGHYQRCEYAVFLCRLCDIVEGARIAFMSVSMTNHTDIAIFAVFIPRQEVHADIIYAQLRIMPEETVDIFACAGILGNDPVEPHVLGRRIQDVDRAIVIQIAESIISAFYFRLTRTVDPEGIVVPTLSPFALHFATRSLRDIEP